MQAKTPKVSVVIAFLDGANFIGEAIDSVVAQSLSDWELILVDDGSTDSSPALARSLADSSERVRYLAHPGGAHRGVAETRALGSRHARGEFLVFLDHDDILYPNALSQMAAKLDANADASAVFACVLYWAFDPSLGATDWTSTYRGLGNGLTSGRRVLRSLIRSDAYHPANCSTLYRRRVYCELRDAGPLYPGMYEETAILFRLLASHDVYLLDRPVAAYRMHSESMCQRALAAGTLSNRGYSEDRSRFLDWASENVPMDTLSRAQLALVRTWFGLHKRLRRSPADSSAAC